MCARILPYAGFLLTSLSLSLLVRSRSSFLVHHFCSFSLPFHERTHFLRVDFSSSFSFVRARFSYTSTRPPFSLSLPVFQSFSVFFFVLLDATFALAHRRLVTSPFFLSFFSRFSRARQNLRSLLFPSSPLIFPSRSTLTPLFVHSVRSRRRFLYCICSLMSSPYYYLVAAVRPPPRYLSRFSTHVNACSLIFLGSLFLAFVPPLPTPPPLPPALRDIFRFPFRYVRSVSDT